MLNQLSYTSLEILGFEPSLLTRKINILPIKLYPLLYILNIPTLVLKIKIKIPVFFFLFINNLK